MNGLYALVLVLNCVLIVSLVFGDDFNRKLPSKSGWYVQLAASSLFIFVAPNLAIAFGCIVGVMIARFIFALWLTPLGDNTFAKILRPFRLPVKRVNRYEKRERSIRDED
ncbi:Uncharacterised protein [Mycolicibacterium phlei]|uniref:Uncharacterized protein n=1 Tax=Mycobacteroides chelonae TaxID=1774 RepID=A0A1S1LZB5_MYCCH|nr:hypothetical protein BB28_05050 [Mycobacteroides chelonae CCUG 47445]OHU78144.1 hypothetical protein BKG84_06790 [Mycobacteroides chelonae]OLT80756.1 hypothetical protein BKG56_00040 [Mycobacteroides chelonae]VEG15173.1 Uncharacterised protein [Mycolicibacterium phlei]